MSSLSLALASAADHPYQHIGKIVNVSVDERVLGEDGKVDLNKFHPIIFDGTTAGYYAFGERVGNAFKDGAQLK